MTGPDLIFFDLGSVVCRFHPARRLAALAAATGLAEPDIHERIWGSGLDADMDGGRYTFEEACGAVADALGCAIPRETLLAAWALASEPDPEVLAVVDALRRERRTALLSDNGPLLLAALPRYLPELAPRFDPLCFSSELGAGTRLYTVSMRKRSRHAQGSPRRGLRRHPVSALKPRLPYGSSLVACVHRLARLQTTREMRPRPEHVDRRERALDRLIVAARHVLAQEQVS
jgi:hypothetical protein